MGGGEGNDASGGAYHCAKRWGKYCLMKRMDVFYNGNRVETEYVEVGYDSTSL